MVGYTSVFNCRELSESERIKILSKFNEGASLTARTMTASSADMICRREEHLFFLDVKGRSEDSVCGGLIDRVFGGIGEYEGMVWV